MTKDQLALLNNMLLVAAADHKLKPIEGAYILSVMMEEGVEIGIITKKLDELWGEWKTPSYVIPESSEAKMENLSHLAGLIWIDGKITNNERKKFIKIAGEFGIEGKEAETLLEFLINYYTNDKDITEIKANLQQIAKELEKGGIKTQWIF